MSIDETEQIKAWWTEFTARAEDLQDLFLDRQDWDLPAWMHEHLQGISEHLMWEFGPAVRGEGHRLVITPESQRCLRPLVKRILDCAPRLDGWEFYAYRLPESFKQAQLAVQGRTGGDISRTFFHATVNDLNKIDLLFVSRDYQSREDRQALDDVFVATETLLGEETLDRWIGAIEVAPWYHGPDEPRGIRDLKKAVDCLIESVRGNLPDVPYFQLSEDSTWTVHELKPHEAEDYPHQWDMFVGNSMIAPMWSNAHQNQTFDSIRFSRHGEVFCYLKIDGINGLEGSQFADKGEIVDAIDAALREAEVGCWVGGGSGLRYSYLDLALTDMDKGAAVVRQVLRAGNIPKRSWILFFDTDRQADWIGIWDDTPPPPTVTSVASLDETSTPLSNDNPEPPLALARLLRTCLFDVAIGFVAASVVLAVQVGWRVFRIAPVTPDFWIEAGGLAGLILIVAIVFAVRDYRRGMNRIRSQEEEGV